MGICISCGKGTLEPKTTSKPYLIVKEQVTQNEMELDTVFVMSGVNKYGHEEHTTSYYLYLNKELGMVGLQLSTMNLTNLYMHELPKGGRSKEGKELVQACTDYSIEQVQELARGKKVVLLMGADVIRTFTGFPSTSVYGLTCKSELLPDVPVCIPAPNADKIMSSPIGELRNALKVFAEQIRIYEAYSRI